MHHVLFVVDRGHFPLFTSVIYCLHFTIEHAQKKTTDEENSIRPRDQRKTFPARKNSPSRPDETKRNPRKSERTVRGRAMSAAAFEKLVSGVSRKKQSNHEDMKPIVTYNGAEDTRTFETKATSSYSHCEVNVIVHQGGSSSSSTCSSVRSFEQRKSAARHTYGKLCDHVFPRKNDETEKENIGQDQCVPGGNTVINSKQITKLSTNETKVDCTETIELQVLENAEGASEGEQRKETTQEIKKLGGSLADMFDT